MCKNSSFQTAKTGTELPALSDYSVNLDHSYGTDSDVSSLPDDDIVSDNDEFVDAIQSHYQLRGLLSEIELDSSSSSSEDIYSHSESSEGNDVDDYADETDNEEGGRGGERINRKEQFRFGRTPYSPRMSRRFSFKKSRNLSSFKTKLSFRKQAVRSAEALDTDFPRRGSKNKIQNQDLENKSEQSLQDFESASVSTMSSKSISASTISTFFPPVPLGEPISYFPTSFTSQHPNPLSMYFDQQMIEHGVPKNMMSNFYSEHVIFLRAVLQLLSEREKVGVEAAADDPNTIKTGPLKKKMSLRKGKGGFGRLGWKMKYVEIRKGLFSYYENSKDSGGELLRKNLSLRANLCSCRPVPKMDQGNNGFVFELINESGTSTTWLSNSREERAAWIRAINEAMIGKSPAQRDINVVDDFESVVTPSSRRDLLQKTPSLRDSISSLFTSQESPSEEKDYDQYHEVKKQVLNATSKESYLSAFDSLWGNSLSIPFRLLKTQPEASNHAVISQLWKQLSRESYSINGHMLQGDTEYGPERILGGLTRCILEYDKIYRDPSFSDNDFSLSISEIQAISYARDILAACSSVGLGKCFSCVEQLCLSPNLALLIPSSSEIIPIKIIVSLFDADSKFAPKIISKERGNEQEKNGWLTTRNRNQKNWRKLFCVLSEGVLSYYEKHYPRPHLLKGQFILVGANIRVSEIKIRGKNDKGDAKGSAQTRHIIRLATANDSKERLFVFEDKEEFFSWKLALKNAIKLCSPSVDTSSASENEEAECKEGMDENKDRSMQKKNFADLFRGAVQRGSVNNISSFTHDLVGEIQRTMAIPPLKDAKIISRLRSRNIANENTVWAETGNRDFHATTDSLRIQLKKPLLQVFKGINTSSESTLKNDVTLQEQKPSLMVNLEAMTVYKICSFMKSEGDLSNDTWGYVKVAQCTLSQTNLMSYLFLFRVFTLRILDFVHLVNHF